jgi:phosphate transport system protein
MPTAFEKAPATLSHRPADLGALVASALEEATRSVLERDHTLGGRVREDAAAVPRPGPRARTRRTLHAPREEDVKAVAAAVCTAVDLTRMGGLARRSRSRGGCRWMCGHAVAAVDVVLLAAALIARRAVAFAAVGA